MFSLKLFRSIKPICQRNFSSNVKSAKVGIIGVGNVGAAVAKNLLRSGYNLHAVFDTNPATLDPLPPNILRAQSSAELAKESEVIVTALPAPPDVKNVMEGPDGVFAGIQKDSVWIDHSTTDFEQTINFAKRVQELGAEALESPVTGGLALLKQGRMTTFVGGEKPIFDMCEPLLQQSCSNVLYMGAMGCATITKVVSNMLAAAHNVTMGESLMMAKRCGVDLRSFFDAIRLSAGNSFVFETEAPLVFNGTYDPNFAIKLHCKDLDLGYKLALKNQVYLPVHGLVQQIYNAAQFRYGGEVGSTTPPRLLEDTLNEPLQIPGFENWTYTIEGVQGGSLGVVQKIDGQDNVAD